MALAQSAGSKDWFSTRAWRSNIFIWIFETVKVMPPSGTVCVCFAPISRSDFRQEKIKISTFGGNEHASNFWIFHKVQRNLVKFCWNVSFETSSPFSFLQPSLLLYVNPNTKFRFFFPRLQNFRDFRRSSGSIVSLWRKGSSSWESWRNWRFFGAYNWLKNGPRMKMSTLSYWKRGCSSCLPYPSLLLTKRVSQSPMISEILKDLESDVTEVPWVFSEDGRMQGRKSPRHH